MAYKPLPGDPTPSQLSSHQAWTKRKKKKKAQEEALKTPMVKLATSHGDGGFVTAPENMPEIAKYGAPPATVKRPTTRDHLAQSIIAADAVWRQRTGYSIPADMMMTIIETTPNLPTTTEEWVTLFGNMPNKLQSQLTGVDGNPVKLYGGATTMFNMSGIDLTPGMLEWKKPYIAGFTSEGAADWVKEVAPLPSPGAIRKVLKKLDNKVRFDLEELNPKAQQAYGLLNYGIVQWKHQWKQVLIDRGVPADQLKWDPNRPDWNEYFDSQFHAYLLGRIIPYAQQDEDQDKKQRAQRLLDEMLPEGTLADPQKDPLDLTKDINYVTRVYLTEMFSQIGGAGNADSMAKELMYRGWIDGRIPGQSVKKARWDYAHEFGFNFMPPHAVEKCQEEARTVEDVANTLFSGLGSLSQRIWDVTNPMELVAHQFKDKPGALGSFMSGLDKLNEHLYKASPLSGEYIFEGAMIAEHGLVTVTDFLHDLDDWDSLDTWANRWEKTEGRHFIDYSAELINGHWGFDSENRWMRGLIFGADLALDLTIAALVQKGGGKGLKYSTNRTFRFTDKKINAIITKERGGPLNNFAKWFLVAGTKKADSIAAERRLATRRAGAAFMEEMVQAQRIAAGEKPFYLDDPLTGVPAPVRAHKPRKPRAKTELDEVSVVGEAEARAADKPITIKEQKAKAAEERKAELRAAAAESKPSEAPATEAKTPKPKKKPQTKEEHKADIEERLAADEAKTGETLASDELRQKVAESRSQEEQMLGRLDETVAKTEPDTPEAAAAEPDLDALQTNIDELLAEPRPAEGLIGDLGILGDASAALDDFAKTIPPPKSKPPKFPRSKSQWAPADLGNGYFLGILENELGFWEVNILKKNGDFVAPVHMDGFKDYPTAVRAAKEAVKDGTVDDILKDKGRIDEVAEVVDSPVTDADVVVETTKGLRGRKARAKTPDEREAAAIDLDKKLADAEANKQRAIESREAARDDEALRALMDAASLEDAPDIDIATARLVRATASAFSGSGGKRVQGKPRQKGTVLGGAADDALSAGDKQINKEILAAREALHQWATEDVAVQQFIDRMEGSIPVRTGLSETERMVSIKAILTAAKAVADRYGYSFSPILKRWREKFGERSDEMVREQGILPYTPEHFKREVNKLVMDMADIQHFDLPAELGDDIVRFFLRSENNELQGALFMLEKDLKCRTLNEYGIWTEVKKATDAHNLQRPRSAYLILTVQEIDAIADLWHEQKLLPQWYSWKRTVGTNPLTGKKVVQDIAGERAFVLEELQAQRDKMIFEHFNFFTVKDRDMNVISAFRGLYDTTSEKSLISRIHAALESGDVELLEKLRADLAVEARSIEVLTFRSRVNLMRSGLPAAKRRELFLKEGAIRLNRKDAEMQYHTPQNPIDDFEVAKPWRSTESVTVDSTKRVMAGYERALKRLKTQRAWHMATANQLEADLGIRPTMDTAHLISGRPGRDAGIIEVKPKNLTREAKQSISEQIMMHHDKASELDGLISDVEGRIKAAKMDYRIVAQFMPEGWKAARAAEIAEAEGFLPIGTGLEYKYAVRLVGSNEHNSHVIHRYGEIVGYVLDSDGHIIGYDIKPLRGYNIVGDNPVTNKPYIDSPELRQQHLENGYLPSGEAAPFKLVTHADATAEGYAKGYNNPDVGGYATSFKVVRDKSTAEQIAFEPPKPVKRVQRGEWKPSVAKRGGIESHEHAIIYEIDSDLVARPRAMGRVFSLGSAGLKIEEKGDVLEIYRIVADEILRVKPHEMKTRAGMQRVTFRHPDMQMDVPEGVVEAALIELLGYDEFKALLKKSPDELADMAASASPEPATIADFTPRTWAEGAQLLASELLLRKGVDGAAFDAGMPSIENQILVANKSILKVAEKQSTKKKTGYGKYDAEEGKFTPTNAPTALDWNIDEFEAWTGSFEGKTRSGVKSDKRVRPKAKTVKTDASLAELSGHVVQMVTTWMKHTPLRTRLIRIRDTRRRLRELDDGRDSWKPIDEYDYRALQLEERILMEGFSKKDKLDPALLDFDKDGFNLQAARDSYAVANMTPAQIRRRARMQDVRDIAEGKKTKQQLLDESAARAKKKKAEDEPEPEYAEGVEELPAEGQPGYVPPDIMDFHPVEIYPLGEHNGGFGVSATPDILSRSERAVDFHTRYRATTRVEADAVVGDVAGAVGTVVREKTELGELLGKIAGLTEEARGKIRPLFQREFEAHNLKQFKNYDAYIEDFIRKADKLVQSGARKADDFLIPVRSRRKVAKSLGQTEVTAADRLRRGRHAGKSQPKAIMREDVAEAGTIMDPETGDMGVVGTVPGEKVTGPKTTKEFVRKAQQHTDLTRDDITEAFQQGIEVTPEDIDFNAEFLQVVQSMAKEHGVEFEMVGHKVVDFDGIKYDVPEMFRMKGDPKKVAALLDDMWSWTPDPEVPPLRALPAAFRNKAEMIAYGTHKNGNQGNFIRHLLGLPDTESQPAIIPYLIRLEAAKHASGKAERGKHAAEGVMDILADMEKDQIFAPLFNKDGGPGLIDPTSPGLFSAARHRMFDAAYDTVGHIPLLGGVAQETLRIVGTPIALERELPLYDKPDFIRNTSWSVKMGRKTMDKKAREQALRHEQAMLMAGRDPHKIRRAIQAWEDDIRANLDEREMLDAWDEYSKAININRARMYVKIQENMMRAYEETTVAGTKVKGDQVMPAGWREGVKQEKIRMQARIDAAKAAGDTLTAKMLIKQRDKAIADLKKRNAEMQQYLNIIQGKGKPNPALERKMMKLLHAEPVYSFQFADDFPTALNMRYLAWFQSGRSIQWITKHIDTPRFGMERWMRLFKMMIMGTIAFPIRVMAGDELWRLPMEGIIPGTPRWKAARETALSLRGGVDPQSYLFGKLGKRLGLPGLDRTILTKAERKRFHELENQIPEIEAELAQAKAARDKLVGKHEEWLQKDNTIVDKGDDSANYRGLVARIDELEDMKADYYNMYDVAQPIGGRTAQQVMSEKNEMDLAEAMNIDSSNFAIIRAQDGHPEYPAALSDWFGKFAREPMVAVWRNHGAPTGIDEINKLIVETLTSATPEGHQLRLALVNTQRIKPESATVAGMKDLMGRMEKKGVSAERYNLANIIKVWTEAIDRTSANESLHAALVRGNLTTQEIIGMMRRNDTADLWGIPMTPNWKYGGSRMGYNMNLPARYYQHVTLPLLGYMSRKVREMLFADRVNQYMKGLGKLDPEQKMMYRRMAEDRAAGWVNKSTFTRNATVFEDLTRDFIPFLNSYRQFWLYWTKMLFTKPLTMGVLAQIPGQIESGQAGVVSDWMSSSGTQVGPFTLYLQSLIPFFLQTDPGEEPTQGVMSTDTTKGLISKEGIYNMPNLEPATATLLGSLFGAFTDGESLENFPFLESTGRSMAPLSRYGLLLESFGIDLRSLMRDSDKLHANWYDIKRQYMETGRVKTDEGDNLPPLLKAIESIPGMHNADAFIRFWMGTFSPVSAAYTPEFPKELRKEQAIYFDKLQNEGKMAAQSYLNHTKYYQLLYEYKFTSDFNRKQQLANEYKWLPNFSFSNYDWNTPYGEIFDLEKGRTAKKWEDVVKQAQVERLGMYGGWGKNAHDEAFYYPGDSLKRLLEENGKKHLKEIEAYAQNAALVYAQGNKKLRAELMRQWRQLTPGMVDFLESGTRIPTWSDGALLPEWYERALKEDGKDLEYWHPGKFTASCIEAAGTKGDYMAAGYTLPPQEAKMKMYQNLVGAGYIPGDMMARINNGPWGETVQKYQKERENDWIKHTVDLDTDQYFQIDVNQLEQLTGKNYGPALEDALRDVRLYYYTNFAGNDAWQKANPVGSDGYKRGRQAFYKYKDERMEGVPGGELFIGGAPERLMRNPALTKVQYQFVGPDAAKDTKLWNAYLAEATKNKPDMVKIEAMKRHFDAHLMKKWEDRQRVNDWVYVVSHAKNLRGIMMDSYSDYYEGPGNSVHTKMGQAMVGKLESLIKKQMVENTLFKSNIKTLFDNEPHELAWHLLDWYNY